jgi:mannosyltransferase
VTKTLQVVCAASLVIGALFLAVSSSLESLWIDELHTAWTVSGRWQDIASRAADGNQTPLYFWLVAVLSGSEAVELRLRAISIVAWIVSLGLVAKAILQSQSAATSPQENEAARKQRDELVWYALFAVLLVVVDRIQWFYASEARPYALVQLVTLAGWCRLLHLKEAVQTHDLRLFNRTVWIWFGLASIAIHLHLTAALPMVLQWATGLMLIASSRANSRISPSIIDISAFRPIRLWCCSAGCVMLVCIPLSNLAFPVWHRRSQWASFASDTSLANTLAQFPLLALCLPVIVCWLLQLLWDLLANQESEFGNKVKERSKLNAVPDRYRAQRFIWCIAALSPLAIAWLATRCGIAPLMHRRFIISCALPMVIMTVWEMRRLRLAGLRWLCAIAILISLLASQGTTNLWRQGQWVGLMRGEDWQAASGWLVEHRRVEEPLWLVSGLVEANNLPQPVSRILRNYLVFPLDGIYPHGPMGSPDPIPLDNDPQRWSASVQQALDNDGSRLPRGWLVYRGSRLRMESKLIVLQQALEGQGILLNLIKPKSFGNLHVVEISRPR